ncbi:HipA domain-containing protein [Ralstonia mannitolilytica]|uniref:hypothetical protein n=1 Tax=Ralstonia mannitolilytica TaxID=105219 RepID=UPI0028F66A8C|nr:hypothetical protein [Ralstonia mannitolilytica]CAJ0742330.1 hypothetical protein R76696_03928 [Ralstonia mannitolilytica]
MFPVISVDPNSAEMFEQLGTKAKFWYRDPQFGRSLFKRGRENTGENWAEKLACELAGAIGVPHAYYELAQCDGVYGVSSPSFVPPSGRLVHGNEILARAKGYQDEAAVVKANYYRSRAHTITLVLGVLMAASTSEFGLRVPDGFAPFHGVVTAADVFLGYLMLDAWIGNQDRHDQNWGLLVEVKGPRNAPDVILTLAPSFDHGSSLARNETDLACEEMLRTKDLGRHISRYVERARSALYPHAASGKTKPLLTIEAFAFARKRAPIAGDAWLARLEAISEERIHDMVDMLPDEFVTPVRREFLVAYLKLNRQRLLALREAA